MSILETAIADALERIAREGFRCSEGHPGRFSCEFCRAGLATALNVVLSEGRVAAGAGDRPPAPQEVELPLRHLAPEQFAAELEAAIPELEAALERLEAAKKITRRVLDLEITI